MSKKTYKHLVLFFLIFSLIFSQTALVTAAGSGTADSGITEDATLDYLKSVMDMIKEKYNGEVTDEQLIEGAVRGMFNTMDPYTSYFTMEEANSFFNSVGGTYSGVGVIITRTGSYIEIVKVLPSSPAEKSGILQGDRIVTIDGKNAVGITTDEAQSLLLGEEGTSVTLGIIRNNINQPISIQVTRETIRINPVTSEIRDGIGYIKLDSFNSNAEEGMNNALQEMDENGITRIILDLRGNPGGEVAQAVGIAEKFVPKGLITRLDYKSDKIKDTEYFSDLAELKYKLVVLVDGNSASASEILAGAVQDTKAGVLVGTKTFGKAKVQSMTPLLTPEAYAKYSEKLKVKTVDAFELINVYKVMPKNIEVLGWSKITVGTYTTPNGRMIDNVGLTPDVVVEDPLPVNGVDVNNIQKLSVTGKFSLNSEGYDVFCAEKILKALGYDVDTPDTLLDEKTYNAVSSFRVDNKLYPGGDLDFTTQKTLNSKIYELILKSDRQYQTAVELLNK